MRIYEGHEFTLHCGKCPDIFYSLFGVLFYSKEWNILFPVLFGRFDARNQMNCY